MTNLTIQNYPADGTTGALRHVGFGVPSDQVNILLAFTLGDNEEDADIEVVVGNGPDHEELIPNLVDTLRNVADMLDEPETQEAWLAQLNDLNEEENA